MIRLLEFEDSTLSKIKQKYGYKLYPELPLVVFDNESSVAESEIEKLIDRDFSDYNKNYRNSKYDFGFDADTLEETYLRGLIERETHIYTFEKKWYDIWKKETRNTPFGTNTPPMPSLEARMFDPVTPILRIDEKHLDSLLKGLIEFIYSEKEEWAVDVRLNCPTPQEFTTFYLDLIGQTFKKAVTEATNSWVDVIFI